MGIICLIIHVKVYNNSIKTDSESSCVFRQKHPKEIIFTSFGLGRGGGQQSLWNQIKALIAVIILGVHSSLKPTLLVKGLLALLQCSQAIRKE